MVKKLFKHECIAYCRVMIPVCVLIIVMSVFARIIQLFESDNVVYDIISGFTFSTFFIVCFASVFAALIFGVIRFYKNLFSAEGYLSFTLPVSSTQHILVKLAAFVLFQSVTVITLAIAFAVVFRLEFIVELFKAADYLLHMIPNITNLHIALYIIEFVILLLISLFSEIFLYYTCIAIGQTRKKNRVAFAIGVYFIYTVIVQILSSIVSVLTTVVFASIDTEKIYAFITDNIIGCIHGFIGGAALFSAAFTAICFLIVKYILNKKLNLE